MKREERQSKNTQQHVSMKGKKNEVYSSFFFMLISFIFVQFSFQQISHINLFRLCLLSASRHKELGYVIASLISFFVKPFTFWRCVLFHISACKQDRNGNQTVSRGDNSSSLYQTSPNRTSSFSSANFGANSSINPVLLFVFPPHFHFSSQSFFIGSFFKLHLRVNSKSMYAAAKCCWR